MKTRNGLVSNSSTSSFILVVTEKAHLEALSKFNDTEKKVLNKIMEIGVFAGIPIRSFGEITDMGGESYPDIYDLIRENVTKGEIEEFDDIEDLRDLFEDYQNTVNKKDGDECITFNLGN